MEKTRSIPEGGGMRDAGHKHSVEPFEGSIRPTRIPVGIHSFQTSRSNVDFGRSSAGYLT
jgi:hypothetical protein